MHLWVRKILWRRKWQPTPVFLPEKSMERGAVQAAFSPWGHKESDTTEPELQPPSSPILSFCDHALNPDGVQGPSLPGAGGHGHVTEALLIPKLSHLYEKEQRLESMECEK